MAWHGIALHCIAALRYLRLPSSDKCDANQPISLHPHLYAPVLVSSRSLVKDKGNRLKQRKEKKRAIAAAVAGQELQNVANCCCGTSGCAGGRWSNCLSMLLLLPSNQSANK